MNIESSDGRGSTFGIVDSLLYMTKAMEELLVFLPADFVWPTVFQASPFSVYVEWGREDTQQKMGESVWLIASPEGVVMNTNFRPGWPDCGASEFDAQEAGTWLQELTKNWKWDASRSESRISSSLQK